MKVVRSVGTIILLFYSLTLSVGLSLPLSSLTACQAADEEGMMVKESNENERDALKALSNDALHSYVPEFRSVVEGEEKDKGILLYQPPTLTRTRPPPLMQLPNTNTYSHSYTATYSTFPSFIFLQSCLHSLCL